MSYYEDKWVFRNSNEYEYKFDGRYGAKGEKREKKVKATPEQIKKQNQKNKENKMRRVIKKNYLPDDIWATLKYEEGTRKELQEVKKDIKNFLSAMRNVYKKREKRLKFVYRLEVGEKGGIHVHILLNREFGDTDLIIQEKWYHGRVYYESIYEYGGYKKLANYIVKVPKEEVEEQLLLFPKEEQKEFYKYSSSRNLIRPEPERKIYERRNMKKLKTEGPIPTDGFYIDKESIEEGVNRFTGRSYFKYTEVRIKEMNRRNERGG